MADKMTILVGTVGQGIMRSTDGGESWRRVGVDKGIHADAVVRALAFNPENPESVFAGSDRGLLHSENAGETWRLDEERSQLIAWAKKAPIELVRRALRQVNGQVAGVRSASIETCRVARPQQAA